MLDSLLQPVIRPLQLLLLLTLLSLSLTVQASQEVRILGYVFPPFVNEDRTSGLTLALIDLLNQRQDQYRFTFVFSTPNRRYLSFKNQQADLILFEMEEWQWQEKQVSITPSSILYHGGEVFISRKQPGHGQEFFNQIGEKKIAIFQGYHYQFAGYNTDRRWLEANFNVLICNEHAQLIDLVERGRADLAVITKAYLDFQIKQRPHLKEKLRISERYDQHYQLRALLSEQAPIELETLESLFQSIRDDGSYQKLLTQFGLQSDNR